MPSLKLDEDEFYDVEPEKNKPSCPRQEATIYTVNTMDGDENPPPAYSKYTGLAANQSESIVSCDSFHVQHPGRGLSGCLKRTSDAFNSRPLFFLSVVFVSLSFAFLLTSLLAITPVKEEKDYLANAFNQSQTLHTMCLISFQSISEQLNSTQAMLNATLKEKAYIQEIADLKTKELESQQKTIADHKTEISNLKTVLQARNNELENLGVYHDAQVEAHKAGTWDFITRLFSGSSASRPSYFLTILTLCLPALLQFLHHINK